MAEIDNVARVGISLDSAAFQDGVARTLRDIDKLLSGLKALQSANKQISLASGGLLGSGSKSPVAGFAKDITRTAIPALRDMERNAIRVGGAVRRSMAEMSRLSAASERAQRQASRATSPSSSGVVQDAKLRRGQEASIRELIKKAEKQGFRFEKTSGGHFVAIPPDKSKPQIFFPSTGGDRRNFQNIRTRMRRAGYVDDVERDERPRAPRRTRASAQPAQVESFADPRSSGGKIEARYVVQALEELVTSRSSAYPQYLQPRARGGAGRAESVASCQRIEEISGRFDPKKIFYGSPNLAEGIVATVRSEVSKAALVLSGNARTLGMQQLASTTPGKAQIIAAVREFITKNPGSFGGPSGVTKAINEAVELVQAGKTPVITRELAASLEKIGPREGSRLGSMLNFSTGMTEAEIAQAIAKTIARIPGGFERGNVGPTIKKGGSAVEELKNLVLAEIPVERVRSEYQTAKGGTSPKLQRLMEGVLLSTAFGNNAATESMVGRILEGERGGIPANLLKELHKAVGPQLQLRGRIASGEIPAGMDPIYNALPEAIELINAAQQVAGGTRRMSSVAGSLEKARKLITAQQTAFGEPSAQGVELASSILASGRGLPAFFAGLSTYGSRAMSATQGGMGLDPSAITADPRVALQIAQEAAATMLAGIKSGQGKGTRGIERLIQEAVEGAIQASAARDPGYLGSAPPASSGGGGEKPPKPPKAPTAAPEPQEPEEPVSMGRPESARSYRLNPRATGTAKGSARARAGGYLPYEESDPARQAEMNKNLAEGYQNLAKSLIKVGEEGGHEEGRYG